jgi:hypothetical protein
LCPSVSLCLGGSKPKKAGMNHKDSKALSITKYGRSVS